MFRVSGSWFWVQGCGPTSATHPRGTVALRKHVRLDGSSRFSQQFVFFFQLLGMLNPVMHERSILGGQVNSNELRLSSGA